MATEKEILRILDANFNRSREGLRVCEDIARFIMNSKALTKELKALRHAISGIISSSPDVAVKCVESRDAGNDCGKIPDYAIEVPRLKAKDVFIANMERAKESVRVLEEFFKIIDVTLSAKLSALRFRLYIVEKKAIKRLGPPSY